MKRFNPLECREVYCMRKWEEQKEGKDESEGGKASCLVTEAKGPRGGRR